MQAITTEAAYDAALARIDELINARDGTPESEELNAIADLVEAYEDEHYPMGWPGPVGALEFYMDQWKLNPGDLVPCFGSLEHVAEVLAGDRPVTVHEARSLQELYGMPEELFLHEETPDETTSADEATPAALAAAG